MAKEKRSIFYSWQSDLPKDTNWTFIEEVLKTIVRELKKEGELEVEPFIDRDIAGSSGAREIANTILDKITKAYIFIGDTSIIYKYEDASHDLVGFPNPNVLVEIGYALNAIKEDRILLIHNEFFGKINLLPFDLQPRHLIIYSLQPEASEEVKEKVINNLKAKLKRELKIILKEESSSIKDKVLNSIDNNRPDQRSLIREFMAYTSNKIELAILKYDSTNISEFAKRVELKIQELTGLSNDFSIVAKRIAEMNALEAAEAVYEGFGAILSLYWHDPTKTGVSYTDQDFDVPRFIGYELFVTFIGLLIHNRRWEILETILGKNLRARVEHNNGITDASFTYLSSPIITFQRNITFSGFRVTNDQSRILAARHRSGLLQYIPLEILNEADYLLYMRTPYESRQSYQSSRWLPWSMAETDSLPEFISLCTEIKTAKKITEILKFEASENLRSFFIRAKKSLLEDHWITNIYNNPIGNFDYNKIPEEKP